MRIGDVDADRRPDVIAAAPGDPARGLPGHAAFCRGREDGPTSCRALPRPTTAGPASLAVDDVDGDGYPDVIGGLPDAGAGGALVLWRGSPRGPAAPPETITQRADEVFGTAEPGDDFGAAVVAARVDGDRFADVLVGAPGENEGAGRVTLVRGGENGFVRSRDAYGAETPGVPAGSAVGRFGAGLALVNVAGDKRRDLVVAVPATGSIVVLPGTEGGFTGAGASAIRIADLSERGTLPAGAAIRLRPAGP
jgi:hypothetical protein